jgi:DNA-binding beta-propeller fold protein YncE
MNNYFIIPLILALLFGLYDYLPNKLVGGNIFRDNTLFAEELREKILKKKLVHYYGQIGKEGKVKIKFGGPFGVHISKNKDIYVADDLTHLIFVFDKYLQLKSTIGRPGHAPGEFSYLDCAITWKKDRLLVADTGNNRVQVVDVLGNTAKVIKRWGFKIKGFNNPRDISVSSIGNIYVTDWGNHCVQVFNSDFKFVKRLGKKGIGKGEFINPITLTHDLDDKLYVSDFKNHRVQVFNPEGEFLFSIGEKGKGLGQFRHPVGLALDSKGNLFVADRNNHRVNVFTNDGRPLSSFGKYGRDPEDFNKPADLDISNDNYLYIVDKGNQRVQVFKIID